MLMPRKTKFRKFQRRRNRGKATNGYKIAFGEFAIKTLEAAYITDRQIEAARRAMTRHIKRGGKVWIRIFPDKSVTRLPAETRMGKGKGNPEFWVSPVVPGKVLFELSGVDLEVAKEALRLASYKLPVKTKFVVKQRTY